MLVLWVLLVSMGLFRAAGALGVAGLDSWVAATHFTSMKGDLVRMMPGSEQRNFPSPSGRGSG